MSPEPWEYDRVEAEAVRCRQRVQERLDSDEEPTRSRDSAAQSAIVTAAIITACAIAGFIAGSAIAL